MARLIAPAATALLAAGLSVACGTRAPRANDGSEKAGASPALARLATGPSGAALANGFAGVPVPREDGPKLAPVALTVPVLSAPARGATAIGYLRLGAKVSRSDAPLTSADCPGGYYAVRPAGFVCAGDTAVTKMDNPLVRAVTTEPDRSRPMPYRYAFVRAIAPNYLRVPTKAEQFQYEMRLERHLRSWTKLAKSWDVLDVGANDVPLDSHGFAVGGIPEEALPLDSSRRFGGDGTDEIPWWLRGERRIPNVSTFKAPPYAVIADRIKRHAGVALMGSFVAGPEAQNRRFAVTTDVRLLPADKLKADSGSPFHGYDIRSTGLPVAFAWEEGAAEWRADGGGLEKGRTLGRRELVPLSGRVRSYRNDRFVEAKDGSFVRSNDVRTAAKPGELPWFAKGDTRWIDVSILSQTMVLWEGATPVYATLVSTGKDGLGDPKTTHSTPTGVFKIYQKHVTTTMDSDMADHEFELRDVPWVQYFSSGFAIHGAYWHDEFGRARSHGCVNLAPIDARYVFFWTAPEVPEHWHAAYAGDTFGSGTLVNIHP